MTLASGHLRAFATPQKPAPAGPPCPSASDLLAKVRLLLRPRFFSQTILFIQIKQIVSSDSLPVAVHDNDQETIVLAIVDQHMAESPVTIQVHMLDL